MSSEQWRRAIALAASVLHTPITFFLDLPIRELLEWLNTASRMPRRGLF
jgi:hypothetical protein